MCGCECFISSKSIHSYLLVWNGHRLKHLKYRSHNAQNRRSGETPIRIFETYKNAVLPHGCHIYKITADMAMETMCSFTSEYHGLPHCKSFCDTCSSIVLPSQEENKDITNMCPTILFFLTIMFHVLIFT